jgi:S-adenosylmethionine:tRNA ribosyltransferase-isomerase
MRSDFFDFIVPPGRIAQTPALRRDESRLMVVRRGTGSIEHCVFRDLPRLLRPDDLLLMNDTRVNPCRLHCTRAGTGGHVELFLLRQIDGWRGAPSVSSGLVESSPSNGPELTLGAPSRTHYEALTGSWKNLQPGERLELPDNGGIATLIERLPNQQWLVEFELPPEQAEAYIARAAKMPLPPYIKRERTDDPYAALDRERYQTVIAANPGAVAAPTAALHFTPELLDACAARGVTHSTVTLHVGPGTFRPLKAATLEEHDMHEEGFTVPESACAAVRGARLSGGRVVVVGSTTCRTIETVGDERGLLRAGSGDTRLFIYPPWRFRCTDALLTNFHLPNSTLIFLVAAWLGVELTRQVYETALAQDYRFFSYGDAMLCLP